jgi:hypothetical protein
MKNESLLRYRKAIHRQLTQQERMRLHLRRLAIQRAAIAKATTFDEALMIVQSSHWSFEPDFRNEKPASTPTDAMPGTPAKIAVIRARLARGESLWHPEDER